MRFVYCACCVSYILNDWSAIDVSLTANYIKRSLVTNSVTATELASCFSLFFSPIRRITLVLVKALP